MIAFIKRYKLVLTVLFFTGTVSTNADAQITDGPYIFYRGNEMVVKSVRLKTGVYTADSIKFNEKSKQRRPLTVHVDGHPEWDFTVKLRKDIKNEPVYSRGTENVIALSDIEGEFEPFRNLLLAAKVIDEHYHWIFGKGSLVVAGDLFDRGKQVAQYLWLLYKLEDEARAKGGAVHVVLGNHELMNLSGDLRYVQPEYFFNAKLMAEEYLNLYATNTELGRWLRSKNVIEKDGKFLVMHGGMSPQLNALRLSLDTINKISRAFYGVLIHQVMDKTAEPLVSGTISQTWYRGYFLDPKATMATVDSTLNFYEVQRILVGHDIIDHVDALYNCKIIGLDVNEHQNSHEALLILKGHYYRLDDKGTKTELFKDEIKTIKEQD